MNGETAKRKNQSIFDTPDIVYILLFTPVIIYISITSSINLIYNSLFSADFMLITTELAIITIIIYTLSLRNTFKYLSNMSKAKKRISSMIFFVIILFISSFSPHLWKSYKLGLKNDYINSFNEYNTEMLFFTGGFILFAILIANALSKGLLWKTVILISVLIFFKLALISLSKDSHSKLEVCTYALISLTVISTLFFNLFKNNKSITTYLPEDQLNRKIQYNRTAHLIRQNAHKEVVDDEQNEFGTALAIYAPWGSGKTHFIKYLEHKLNIALTNHEIITLEKLHDRKMYQGSFKVCNVNLWESNSTERALVNITNELYTAIVDNPLFSIHTPPTAFFASIINVASIFSPNLSNLNSIIDIIHNSNSNLIQKRLDCINESLGEERIVLILEDIERAHPEVIDNLLPIIEKIKKIKKLTIVASIDKVIFEENFKNYNGSNYSKIAEEEDSGNKSSKITERDENRNTGSNIAQGFLTKVFNNTIYISETPEQLLRSKAILDAKKMYHNCPFLHNFLQKEIINFDTARQIERLLALWANIERLYFNHLEKEDFSLIGLHEIEVIFIYEGIKYYEPKLIPIIKESMSYDEIRGKFNIISNTNSIFINSIKPLLSFDRIDYGRLKDAADEDYLQRVNITLNICRELILLEDGYSRRGFKESLRSYFNNEITGDQYDDAISDLIKYTIELSYTDGAFYKEFLKSGFRGENKAETDEQHLELCVVHEAKKSVEEDNKEILDLIFNNSNRKNAVDFMYDLLCDIKLHAGDNKQNVFRTENTEITGHITSGSISPVFKHLIELFTERYADFLTEKSPVPITCGLILYKL